MKQLAIIATVFLPLTFLTGFFGQNFGWLVDHGLASEAAFFGLGLGGLLASCLLLILWFRRKGWS
jgi:magnesium transporter